MVRLRPFTVGGWRCRSLGLCCADGQQVVHGGEEGRPSLEALERVARTPLRLGNVPQIEARRSFSSGFWLVLKWHTKSRYLPKNKPPEPYDAGDLLALWYALRWRDSGRKATKVGKATRGVWHPSSMAWIS